MPPGWRVSTLCREGFLAASDWPARRVALDDNRRAIDEAATLGTHELVPCARGRSVRLALESMHPILASDRGALQTLGQALDLAVPFPADVVGMVVDTYHVWWDPQCSVQIDRAAREGRPASYQVCDWILPFAPEPLNSWGLMGVGADGRRLHRLSADHVEGRRRWLLR